MAPPPSLTEARLYLLATQAVSGLRLVPAVEAAIRGGVQLVQLREKDLPDGDFTALARRVQTVCRAHGVPLIVNDRIHIAAEIGADGVHLGQDDGSVAAARELLPAGTLIGLSTHDAAELEGALSDGVDYVGVGSLFPTTTKTTPVPVSGPAALAELVARSEAEGVPAFGIGGVTIANVGPVVGAGIGRVAVCAGILANDDPAAAARAFARALTPRA